MRPIIQVKFKNEDITQDIQGCVAGLNYTDNHHGSADDLSLTIQDPTGLWRNDIFPRGGESIAVKIGYEGKELLDCGVFEVDQPRYGKSTISIQGQSTAISKPLREKVFKNHEKTDLKKIVQSIADKHGFELLGEIKPIAFKSKNQDCSDIEFLNSLAEDFGYFFRVGPDFLLFSARADFEQAEPVKTLALPDLLDVSFSVNYLNLFGKCEIHYKHRGKYHKGEAESAEFPDGPVLKENKSCENATQATAMAAALLERKNREYITGEITVVGNPKLAAGYNIEIVDAGELSGIYQIRKSKHNLSNSGYTTNLEIYYVY